MEIARPFDCCIIGSGPAGIVLALELANHGQTVCLVDSGEEHFDPQVQALGDAAILSEATHAPMNIATRRQVGGATNIWGGRVVPYDPIDFAERPYIENSAWPVSAEEINRHLPKACDYFKCGEPVFSSKEMKGVEQVSIVPNLRDGDVLSTSLERWSLPTNFRTEYASQLKNHPRIHCVFGFTCVGLETTPDDSHVSHAVLKSMSGEDRSIHAKRFVVCCGGLESTRLLFASGNNPNGLGNSSGMLGKFYMGHLSGRIASVQFTTDPKRTRYGFLRDQDGVYVRQRFTFSETCQRKHELLNTAIWLVNPEIGDPDHRNGIYSFVYLLLASPLGRLVASEAIRLSAIKSSHNKPIMAHLANIAKDFPRVGWFFFDFGSKRMLAKRKIPSFFQYSHANRYPLHYHAEQIPHASSCVSLSNERDALGMPRLNIDFKFQEQDVQSVVATHEILDRELRSQNVGHLEYAYEDLHQAIWDQATDGYHQAGTTRMAASPDEGVVDRNCQVFGVDNLYVVSGSCLPTSSQANTTCAIVCLALRLAEHLGGPAER